VRYIHDRVHDNGDEPTVLHYASFKRWPGLSASLLNPARGKVVVKPRKKRYEFEGMNAVAIGTSFPEFEPNRLSTNHLWHSELKKYDRFILVTGSAQTGFMLAQEGVRFTAWVSSIVDDDRKERLKRQNSIPAKVEKTLIGAIKTKELGVLRSASRILAVSDDTSAALRRLDASLSPEVWPFPVDTDLFTPSEEIEVQPYLTFVGRANDPRKDLRLFLRVLLHVREIMPNVSADVVSHEPSWYRREEEWRTLAGNVRFHHGITDEELCDIYQRSTALLITSEQEGLNIAGLEAMACGSPVISTRCGGPQMFIRDGENGYLAERDGDDLGQKALYLLEDAQARRTMSLRARDTVTNNFSRKIWDARFQDLLSKL
jgi:glycosyltransferase involved in cell wall biosynthesis